MRPTALMSSVKQVCNLLIRGDVLLLIITFSGSTRQSLMHRDMQSAQIAEPAYIAARLGFQILKSDIGAQRFASNLKQNKRRMRKWRRMEASLAFSTSQSQPWYCQQFLVYGQSKVWPYLERRCLIPTQWQLHGKMNLFQQ
jgi:hypothetical protein